MADDVRSGEVTAGEDKPGDDKPVVVRPRVVYYGYPPPRRVVWAVTPY